VVLFTAEQYDRGHAAMAVLLGLNGLRVSPTAALPSGMPFGSAVVAR
jgi:hypothetical protein